MLSKFLALTTTKVVTYTLLGLLVLVIVVWLFGPDTVAGWIGWAGAEIAGGEPPATAPVDDKGLAPLF